MQTNVRWFNPNATTTALDYNPLDQRLYFYNKGQMLSVNVRTIDVGETTTPVNGDYDA
jgi:hypothetical protein